jgi:hypothetical protein
MRYLPIIEKDAQTKKTGKIFTLLIAASQKGVVPFSDKQLTEDTKMKALSGVVSLTKTVKELGEIF